MEGSHTFPKETATSSASNEQIKVLANQAQDDWEASQGPNFQPLEDHEREEMIRDRFEALIKQRDAQEGRDKIEDVLNKAA